MIRFSQFILIVSLGLLPVVGKAGTPLSADATIPLPGKAAKFDFMATDSSRDRVLAAHKEAGMLTVLELNRKTVSEIPLGHAQGIAVDDTGGNYFVGDDDEHRLIIVDAKSLAKAGEVALPGPVDAVEFDPKNGLVYADEDDGKRVWVVDPRAKKLVATITIPGVPEVLAYDPDTNRIYQNIKDKDVIVVINPETDQVESSWSTAPVVSPHGLALDRLNHRALVAGRNGKVAALDLASGKVVATADIAASTDQIAFDDSKALLYCASKGAISAVQVTNSGLQSLGRSPDTVGAHTIAVDRKRHAVWISYAAQGHSYLQSFAASP